MKVQVRITRTDTGSNTRIKSEPEDASTPESKEANKDYGSWAEALTDAERLGLLSGTEAAAAKIMPPGMPYNSSTDVDASVFEAAGFVAGKSSPPQ